MLNKVIIMGRITRDLELKSTPQGTSVLRFTVAVDRNYARPGEERKTDFISCVAWRQQAEFINNYFGKGRMIAIEGSIQTGTYDDKTGVRHYTTDIVVDRVSFTGEPKQGGSSYQSNYSAPEAPAFQAQPSEPPKSESVSIGDLSDFEEILSDDGVPF